MKSLGWLTAVVATFLIQDIQSQCYHPGNGAHVIISATENPVTFKYATGTQLVYGCDAGYTIFQNNTRVCQKNGTWSGAEPFCAIRVYGSTYRSDINDGHLHSCDRILYTNATFDFEFLEPVVIHLFKVSMTGENYTWGQDTRFEIALFRQNGLQMEPLSINKISALAVWFQAKPQERYIEFALHVASPEQLESVRVDIRHSYNFTFYVCEISWYSITAPSPSQCIREGYNYNFGIYLHKCYILHSERLPQHNAEARCRRAAEDGSGSLAVVSEKDNQLLRFLYKLWKDNAPGSNTASVQDKHSKGSCPYLYFGESIASLHYFFCEDRFREPFICEKAIVSCGQPSQTEKSKVSLGQNNHAMYSCPPGHKLDGNAERKCQNGSWAGQAPNCIYRVVQCPMFRTSDNVAPYNLHENRTVGSCRKNVTRTDSHTVKEWYRCTRDGQWVKHFNCTCNHARNCPPGDDMYRIIIGSVIGIVTVIITTTWVLVGIYVWRYQRLK